MRTSLKGRQFIAAREAAVLQPYPDGPNRFSIGFGGWSSKDAAPITVEAAWNILGENLKEYEQYVNNHLGNTTVTQGIFDSLVSLYYNTGPGNKESLIALIKAGNIYAAADLLLTYDQNQGVESARHLKRRQQERRVFLFGDYGNLREILVWPTSDTSTEPERRPMPTTIQ
jgi:GH24 family phage-related lysozyme (muramidase)